MILTCTNQSKHSLQRSHDIYCLIWSLLYQASCYSLAAILFLTREMLFLPSYYKTNLMFEYTDAFVETLLPVSREVYYCNLVIIFLWKMFQKIYHCLSRKCKIKNIVSCIQLFCLLVLAVGLDYIQCILWTEQAILYFLRFLQYLFAPPITFSAVGTNHGQILSYCPSNCQLTTNTLKTSNFFLCKST